MQSTNFIGKNESNRFSCLLFIQNWDIDFGHFRFRVIISDLVSLLQFIGDKVFIELFLRVKSVDLCGSTDLFSLF
jgi:hypothetical protein